MKRIRYYSHAPRDASGRVVVDPARGRFDVKPKGKRQARPARRA